jgi:hypothetical protein
MRAPTTHNVIETRITRDGWGRTAVRPLLEKICRERKPLER